MDSRFRTRFFGVFCTLFASAAVASFASPGRAIVADLVADLGTGGLPGSSPSDVIDTGSTTLFTANGPLGRELYISDGTAPGTQVLIDIYEGQRSARPSELTPMGGFIYFAATDGVAGRELWRTDGSAAGTTRVVDLNPSGDANPIGLEVIDGLLYFAASDGLTGIELWQSDGTAAGTVQLADIHPGGDAFFPNVAPNLVETGSGFFFAADDGVHGRELWISDGTSLGTQLVLDILPGAGSSMSSLEGAMAGSQLMFAAEDAQGFGNELWRSDGTAVGSQRLVDLNPVGSSNANSFIAFAGRVFFVADGGNLIGREVFVTDGSFSGTSLFVDTHPGGPDGLLGGLATGYRVLGAQLLFNVNAGPNEGLWATDGTTASFLSNLDLTANLGAELGGLLYFEARMPAFPSVDEIWRTDGTAAGTQQVTNLALAPIVLGVSQGELWLSLANADGREPWRSDGTPVGTVQVADLLTTSGVDSNPQSPVVFGGATLFAADSDDDGFAELWKTAGTPATTEQLTSATLDPDPLALVDFAPAQIHPSTSRAFFAASVPGQGEELWTTDGTAAGTAQLADLNPGTASSGPAAFFDLAGTTLFVANDGAGGEPWRSDGTAAGTFRLMDIHPSGQSISAGLLVSNSDAIFYPLASGDAIFSAFNPAIGTELYKTDGTVAGTEIVADLNGTSSGATGPSSMSVLGGKLYYTGDDGSTGLELYESDGTLAGTQLVADLATGLASSTPRFFTVAGSTLFFVADDPLLGAEIYASDGTAGGTIRLTDLTSSPTNLTAAGSTLFFSADEPGGDLWTSDGTLAGTSPVGLFNSAGPFLVNGFASGMEPIAIGSQLVFAGDDGLSGVEPWISNGTLAGTVPLTNLGEAPGGLEGDSDPAHFGLLPDGRLLFAGNAANTGRELWALDLPEPGFALGAALGALALLATENGRNRRRRSRPGRP